MNQNLFFVVPSKIDALLIQRERVIKYLREVGECAATAIFQDTIFCLGLRLLDPTNDDFLEAAEQRETIAGDLIGLIDAHVLNVIQSN